MKLLIIGIDGGTWTAIDKIPGKLRHISELRKQGLWGTLMSTIPPVTAAAWSSFMTGRKPGLHPFFDFKKYNITDYNYTFEKAVPMRSEVLQGATIWDVLGERNLKTASIYIPMTYPAWKIKDIMISGFPAPNFDMTPEDKKLVKYARKLILPEIRKMSAKKKFSYCSNLVKTESKLCLLVGKKYMLDVLAVNFLSSDIIQHYFWKSFESNNMHSSYIPYIYKLIDDAIGKLIKVFNPKDTVIFSDHGFGLGPYKEFFVNSWLSAKGLLYVEKNKNRRYPISYVNPGSIDFRSTKAYRFPLKPPAEGIVLNLKNRQKYGVVKPSEYDELRKFIKEEMQALRHDGVKVVRDIFYREELYGQTQFVSDVPDIIYMLNPEYKCVSKITKEIFGYEDNPFKDSYSGMHRREGIFIFSRKRESLPGSLSIYELPYYILDILEINKDLLKKKPINILPATLDSEKTAIHNKLFQLGYV